MEEEEEEKSLLLRTNEVELRTTSLKSPNEDQSHPLNKISH